MTMMIEYAVSAPLARITAEDSFIPIGKASTVTLPDVSQIVSTALCLCGVQE